MPLQIRRGTNAERVAMTQPLASGELLWITDDQRLYVGNGTTLPGSLVSVTGYTNENAQDAAASLFTSGSHNNISFTYVDGSDRIDANVDLSAYNSTIKGDLIGSVFGDTSTRLIDGTNGLINLDGTIGGNVVPNADSSYDLGSSSYKFKDLYLSGSSIHLGSAIITSTGTVVNLPAGSLIDGKPIGIPGGDLNVNIVADDSTVMVNTVTEVITAQGGFVGNILGNIIGDVSGNVNGIVTALAGSSLTGTIIATAGSTLTGVVTATTGSSLVGNVTGDLTGNVVGNVRGDLRGSVFGDDSSMMVDATSGRVYANINTSELIARNIITFISTTDNQVNHYGETSGATAYAGFSANGFRGTYESPTTIQNNDIIAFYSWEGWNGSEYKKAAVASAQIMSSVSGGNFDASLNFSILSSSGSYQNFTMDGETGVFGTLGIGFTPLTTLEISSAPPAEGALVYNTDVNTLQLYTGSAFKSVPTIVDAPINANDPGLVGQIAYDSTHIYICIGTNSWIRSTAAAW